MQALKVTPPFSACGSHLNLRLVYEASVGRRNTKPQPELLMRAPVGQLHTDCRPRHPRLSEVRREDGAGALLLYLVDLIRALYDVFYPTSERGVKQGAKINFTSACTKVPQLSGVGGSGCAPHYHKMFRVASLLAKEKLVSPAQVCYFLRV